MEGLIEEGKEMLEKRGSDAAKDAGIISAAQKVEHYEIAAYGTACAHARATGNTVAEQLLQQTLEEEKETDRLLTEIAEGGINEWANEEEEFSLSGQMGNGGGFANGRSFGGSRGNNGGANGRATARATTRSAGRKASGSTRGSKNRKSGRSSSRSSRSASARSRTRSR